MTNQDDHKVLCPSARCELGSSLLGIVNREGRIAFLNTPVELQSSFIQIAHKGRPPGKRFRFTAPCLETGCTQWIEGRCSVVDTVIAAIHDELPEEHFPTCGIRSSCRWFRQSGYAACTVCENVVTDTTDETEACKDEWKLEIR
jgi:hypothetical protein